MAALSQRRTKGDHRVARPSESHLKGVGLVNLCHEIATSGLTPHAEHSAFEGHIDLGARIAETQTLRVLETDTANILDMRVGGSEHMIFSSGAQTEQQYCRDKKLLHLTGMVMVWEILRWVSLTVSVRLPAFLAACTTTTS